MTLTYKFTPEDEWGFEKDLYRSEIEDYFKQLNHEEKVDALKTAFNSFSNKDKEEIAGEMGDTILNPEFDRWVKEDFDYCLDLIMEDTYLFEDELHDYFEQEAYDEWWIEQNHALRSRFNRKTT